MNRERRRLVAPPHPCVLPGDEQVGRRSRRRGAQGEERRGRHHRQVAERRRPLEHDIGRWPGERRLDEPHVAAGERDRAVGIAELDPVHAGGVRADGAAVVPLDRDQAGGQRLGTGAGRRVCHPPERLFEPVERDPLRAVPHVDSQRVEVGRRHA